MLQREIGNAKITSPGSLPQRGDRIPEFVLPTAVGSQVALSDFRGNRNLVMLFLGPPENDLSWAKEIADQHWAIETRNASLLLCTRANRETAQTLPKSLTDAGIVLCDSDGALHRSMCATVAGQVTPAAYVTDRFGEVIALWRTSENLPFPDVREILNWLDYIENICPECEPPEWPLD